MHLMNDQKNHLPNNGISINIYNIELKIYETLMQIK